MGSMRSSALHGPVIHSARVVFTDASYPSRCSHGIGAVLAVSCSRAAVPRPFLTCLAAVATRRSAAAAQRRAHLRERLAYAGSALARRSFPRARGADWAAD